MNERPINTRIVDVKLWVFYLTALRSETQKGGMPNPVTQMMECALRQLGLQPFCADIGRSFPVSTPDHDDDRLRNGGQTLRREGANRGRWRKQNGPPGTGIFIGA